MTEHEASRIVGELRKERRKEGRRNKGQGEAAPPEEVVLSVGSMAHKGAALGRLDGRVGLVDYAIPGEEVRVAIRQGKRDYFAGEAVEVLRAAPERVAPPCPYFGPCGGCQWQHIDYAAQLAFKRGVVEEQLRRIGGLDLRVGAVHSAEPWSYRHSAAIALGHAAGFRSRYTRWEIAIDHCLISHPAISALMNDLNGLIARGEIANFRGKLWLEVKVIHPTADADAPAIQAVLKGIAGVDPEGRPDIAGALARIAALPGVWSLAFRRAKGGTETVKGPLNGTVLVADRAYQLPSGSFFQTNLGLLPELLARVETLAAPFRGGTIADLYCGAGLFALWLARDAPETAIVGIEVDPLAIAAAEETARRWGVENCRFVARPAEKALHELPEVDLVIVDPPRSGLEEKLLRALIERGPEGFIYVSCEPSTLARDLAILVAGGYKVESVELFDFFPQTYHVESLAFLRRGGPRGDVMSADTPQPLILASGSPRRRELLGRLGLPFVVLPSDVDETPAPGLTPEEVARSLARQKAAAVAAGQPGRVVIGADTVVIPHPGETAILGKPRDDADAARMLRALRGRWHRVATGIAIVRDDREWHDVIGADVRMADYGDDDIATYVASGEPRDKAGAYAVQGLGGRLVAEVSGSELTVVGLPLHRLAALLAEAGVALPIDPATLPDRWRL